VTAGVIQHPTQLEATFYEEWDKPRRLFTFLIWIPNLPRRGYTFRREFSISDSADAG